MRTILLVVKSIRLTAPLINVQILGKSVHFLDYSFKGLQNLHEYDV